MSPAQPLPKPPAPPSPCVWQPATGPSAGLVKQHLVRARHEELMRRNPQLEAEVAQALSALPVFKGLKLTAGKKWSKDLSAVYSIINASLQKCELTINFQADKWFSSENKRDAYTQMYENQQAQSGGLKQLKGDVQNPADLRAAVDDRVTVPAAWAAAAPAQRGLSPGPNRAGVARQMQFGKPQAVPAAVGVVQSDNPYFNPKTKQVFAALNYGRRPHGSSMQYGDAHLVLHDRFKVNALYFGRDTFFITGGADAQCAYGMLAAVVAQAHPLMVAEIVKSCYEGVTLPDLQGSKAADFLLEAHLFEPLTFTGNLKRVVLDARYDDDSSPVARHAKTFAKKHGAKLAFV